MTLQKVGDLCSVYASASADPAPSFYVAYHFVAELEMSYTSCSRGKTKHDRTELTLISNSRT